MGILLGELLKFKPGVTTGIASVTENSDTIKANNNHNGGGSDMDQYVKKHELEATKNEILTEIKLLAKDVQRNQELSNEKFSSMDQKFSTLNDKMNWILGILGAIIAAIILKYFFNI